MEASGPTAIMRSPAIATACAKRKSGSTVMTFAFLSTGSAESPAGSTATVRVCADAGGLESKPVATALPAALAFLRNARRGSGSLRMVSTLLLDCPNIVRPGPIRTWTADDRRPRSCSGRLHRPYGERPKFELLWNQSATDPVDSRWTALGGRSATDVAPPENDTQARANPAESSRQDRG